MRRSSRRVRLVERIRQEVLVAGQNLADREHVASAFINGTSGRFYEPGLPRAISGGITLRWR